MAALHESAVSLSFFGDDLEPAEISNRLGGLPTFGVSKGASWKPPRGGERIARTGSWRLQAPRSVPGDLPSQIESIFAPLTGDISVWQELAARFNGRLFCGLFLKEGNEGLRIERSTLATIADRGLFLDLDLYAPDRSEDDRPVDSAALGIR